MNGELPEYKNKTDETALNYACLALLKEEKITNQEQLKNLLISQGFYHINQSLISKLLTRIGAIKITNAAGEKFYSLIDTKALSSNEPIAQHISGISHNNHFVLIKTTEGFAQATEQLFKHNCAHFILGCIGGFNSIMLIPAKNITAKQCEVKLRRYLNQL